MNAAGVLLIVLLVAGVIVLSAVLALTVWVAWRLGVRVGETVAIGARTLTLERMENRTGPNFRSRTAVFAIRDGGTPEGTIEASRRLFSARQMATTEAGIRTFGLSLERIS